MNEHETIADLIAWLRRPREGENAYLTLWRDEIADRFEAAHKRDCAKIEADALAVGGVVEASHMRELSKNTSKNGADFGQLGDAAKLREALEALMIDFDSNYADDDDIASWCDVNVETVRKARAALSTQPRNCDLPEAAKDPWRAWLDDKSNWEEGYPKLEIHDWLLATATEKEGGDK